MIHVLISDALQNKKKKYRLQDNFFLGFIKNIVQFKIILEILGCLFRMILDKQGCTLVNEASKGSTGARFLEAHRALKF